MIKLVIFIFTVTAVCGDVSHILASTGHIPDPQSPVLRREIDIKEDGSYRYYYETGNGIVGHEDAEPVESPDSGSSVSGGFHYTSPEGKLIKIDYKAGKDGFQASGDSVPTARPIIKRSIDYNAARSAK